jgi:Uma2 family endonuclease
MAFELTAWVRSGGDGEVVPAPGVIFDEENAVAPDVVWVSKERLPLVLGEDGKLHDAPDLAVEVLSPGTKNTRRDREAKLRLYSTRGVREYWIADWQAKSLQVFRREQAVLKLVVTLLAEDELTSPLLPGFKVNVARLFPG